MIENNKLPHQPELSGLNASLSALKNIQEVFKALVRITPYPITIWSPDGKLLYANNNAIEFNKSLGFKPQHITFGKLI